MATDPSKPYGDVSYADPGYQSDGKKRYPLDSEEHCRTAWSYVNQAGNAAKYSPEQLKHIKARIMAAGKKYGITFADQQRDVDEGEYRRVPETCTRGFDFEMRSSGSDGRTLEGYVAMFGTVARIPDRGGDFDEELHPGFADRSLSERTPVMQFDHGKDPRVGTVPIGVYDTFDKDSRGYFVRGRLFDNPVVEPVRQAIAGKAIKGMSFRFSVKKPGGDRWNRRNKDGVDKRDILDADVHEAGPVVFPAYAQTSVTVRSLFASATEEDRAALFDEFLSYMGEAVDLPYFTGQWAARSDHGGETDDESWEDEASTGTTSTEAARALALLRPVLP
jgi:HK97 family phage prohead protease